MKSLVLLFSVFVLINTSSCQSSGYKEAVKTKAAIEAVRPGSIPTAPGQFMMTAKIDGQAWTASAMMPVEDAGRIIGYAGKQYISMPKFEKKFLKLGKKEVFGKDNAVDLSLGNDPVYCSGYSGEMIVTKIDGDWMEAKFWITAGSDRDNKKFQITDGFVRLKLDSAR